MVVSGINMVEGGIFTILDTCLQALESFNENNDFEITALVANKSVFNYKNIKYIEFPKSKKYWFFRFYYEYFYFRKLSKKIQPDVWLSLHDMTPNVVCKKQFVYCHNPMMFYKPSAKEWFFDYKIGLFSVFYKYLYQINIKKNVAVFVQQNWMKDAFQKVFKIDNVVVSQPKIELQTQNFTHDLKLDNNKIHFFYPSFPRSFKNFELIFEAIKILDSKIADQICFHFTLNRNAYDRYSKYLFKKYRHVGSVHFLGILSKNEVESYYKAMDCLVFPSKLETWGLPISETKFFEKPMFLANLPYAKETVGTYQNVSFFDVKNPKQLAELITNFVHKTLIYQGNIENVVANKKIVGWKDLFDFMTSK